MKLLLLLSLIITACRNADDDLIVEPAGAASYFIKNNSSSDISVAFTTFGAPGTSPQIYGTIPAGDRQEIFKDGSFGFNPMPRDSFGEITFSWIDVDGETTVVYSPIVNEDWEITFEDFESGDYGVRFYEYAFP
ncbi:MAG: hypothetical protein AAGF77_06420 [Bacteroidota bacterium]